MANNHSKYQIIRVTPTLDTSAYDVDDVLFTATAIPNAVLGNGGCSKLLAMYVLDKSDYDGADIEFYFSEKNTTNLGTINATANISNSNFKANNFIGYNKLDADQAQSGNNVDNVRCHQVFSSAGEGENVSPLMLLQADSTSTSVYVQGIITAGTPTYAADSLELIFHIERQ